mmetsp:Transcript_59195/g.82121  ORF Transcript_59195/g.82121 Transcript_59195/m.82121 type:complete len:247 (+) Transcript_59195:347-1087(+)
MRCYLLDLLVPSFLWLFLLIAVFCILFLHFLRSVRHLLFSGVMCCPLLLLLRVLRHVLFFSILRMLVHHPGCIFDAFPVLLVFPIIKNHSAVSGELRTLFNTHLQRFSLGFDLESRGQHSFSQVTPCPQSSFVQIMPQDLIAIFQQLRQISRSLFFELLEGSQELLTTLKKSLSNFLPLDVLYRSIDVLLHPFKATFALDILCIFEGRLQVELDIAGYFLAQLPLGHLLFLLATDANSLQVAFNLD